VEASLLSFATAAVTAVRSLLGLLRRPPECQLVYRLIRVLGGRINWTCYLACSVLTA